ncbi:MAG: VWA domain-containing protein [Acidobacteriaceae bacterium]|nr:VWA domain-containing protein [Acidobacteriaceae bacterium]
MKHLVGVAAIVCGLMPAGLVPCHAQIAPPATGTQTAAPPASQEDSGPATDNGPIVIPKKKPVETAPPPPPAPAEPVVVNPPKIGNVTIRVDSSLVNVNVSVLLDKTKMFVPNLTAKNFAVYEDGVLQPIRDVKVTQTPITAVMLLEFAANSWAFINDMRNSASVFFDQLRPDDYIAVVTYDMRTQILTDFTSDKTVVQNSLETLTIPGMSDSNMFDALYETLDRLTRVEGRKDIILISSGRDTFSKINLDQILAKVKATPNVTIFSIGTGQFAREMTDGMGRMGPISRMNYLQADNQMKTFAQMTGGQAFFPMFQGALPDVFRAINQQMRSEYVVTYKPTNMAQDGTYRKLHVELIDGEGHPLRMADEKGKPLKYSIIARDGYTAKRAVE